MGGWYNNGGKGSYGWGGGGGGWQPPRKPSNAYTCPGCGRWLHQWQVQKWGQCWCGKKCESSEKSEQSGGKGDKEKGKEQRPVAYLRTYLEALKGDPEHSALCGLLPQLVALDPSPVAKSSDAKRRMDEAIAKHSRQQKAVDKHAKAIDRLKRELEEEETALEEALSACDEADQARAEAIASYQKESGVPDGGGAATPPAASPGSGAHLVIDPELFAKLDDLEPSERDYVKQIQAEVDEVSRQIREQQKLVEDKLKQVRTSREEYSKKRKLGTEAGAAAAVAPPAKPAEQPLDKDAAMPGAHADLDREEDEAAAATRKEALRKAAFAKVEAEKAKAEADKAKAGEKDKGGKPTEEKPAAAKATRQTGKNGGGSSSG